MTDTLAFADGIAAAAESAPQAPVVTPLVPGLTLHIDGDYLAYRASGPDDTLPGQARLNLLGIVETFRARVGAEHVVVHVTVPGSNKGERFLCATVKPYQAQRSASSKPKNQPYLQGFLLNYTGTVFRSKLWSTREADDGIGACAHHAVGTPVGYAAIATKDKDLRMLPGVHINWDTPTICTRVPPGEYDVIGEDGKQYGLKWFFLQMLQGDAADNCPGLEMYINERGKPTKIGEKTAIKLLSGCTSTREACAVVMNLYREYYKDWADRFVEQASLLWMRCSAATAPVDDFATHSGWSRINQAFDNEIHAAVKRLNERVTAARQSLNELQG